MVKKSLISASAPSKAPLITQGRSLDRSVDGEREENQADLSEYTTTDEKDSRDAIRENDVVKKKDVVGSVVPIAPGY